MNGSLDAAVSRGCAAAVLVLVLASLPCLASAAPPAASSTPSPSPTASADTVQAGDAAPVQFFGNTAHLQATAEQVTLAAQSGPLPIVISGNAQTWVSGPPMANLYTQTAQGTYRINDRWQLLGQELYQQQAAVQLMDFVGGFNYRADANLSINATVGVGDHTLYTYQFSTYVAPQYRLPWTVGGAQRVALEANVAFENYALGNFLQVTPKVDLDVARWFPQLQVGYAFGDFSSVTGVSKTQYYQPQTLRGVTLIAVFHPLQQLYIVSSYLPENRNYIAGNEVVQNTVAATLHWNAAHSLRLSAYGEQSWYPGGSYRALGFSLGF